MPPNVSNRDAQVQIPPPAILELSNKIIYKSKKENYLEILVHISLGRSPLDSKILVDSALLY